MSKSTPLSSTIYRRFWCERRCENPKAYDLYHRYRTDGSCPCDDPSPSSLVYWRLRKQQLWDSPVTVGLVGSAVSRLEAQLAREERR